jgi:hypothetical protein
MIKDLSLHRVEATKPEEWIKNYLKPTDFSSIDSDNLYTEFSNFIIDNCEHNIVYDYNLNGCISDFFIPDLKIAFKFLKLKDFCELKVNKKHQLQTYLEYENNNIHIIQIFEDLWRDKKSNIQSRILNLFGKSEKIWARKCEVVVLSSKDSKFITQFINNNHLQGSIGSYIKLALKYNNEIVSIMTFGKLRKNLGQIGGEGMYEMLRFCSKSGYVVVGGASKLFNFFVSNYDPVSITSYADMMWSNSSNIYKKIGLEFKHRSDPSYFYIIGTQRKNRFGYRKNVLLECGYDGKYWGEHDICFSNGVYRIYDIGTEKFVWSKKQ